MLVKSQIEKELCSGKPKLERFRKRDRPQKIVHQLANSDEITTFGDPVTKDETISRFVKDLWLQAIKYEYHILSKTCE